MENLNNKGVYKITNNVNGKCYIGSTSESFERRWYHHEMVLNAGTHKNSHLQYAWDKYGKDNFKFEIVEIINDLDLILSSEQHHIDSYEFEMLYNINRLATGGCQFSKDILDRRANTLRKLNKERSLKYKLWKSGKDIQLTDVELSLFKKWSNRIPWNKGKKYSSTEHLKVPKSKKGDRSSDKETKRENSENIEVFDKNRNYLGEFRSAKDLEEFSVTEKCDFDIIQVKPKLKGKGSNVPYRMLRAPSVRKACYNGKPYKGLYFKFKE